MTALVVTARET